jgi:hypothetical protein
MPLRQVDWARMWALGRINAAFEGGWADFRKARARKAPKRLAFHENKQMRINGHAAW